MFHLSWMFFLLWNQELQLDLCGHCMPDYILSDTLARSPNCLPALITTSLRGAHRLSDNGLRALVSSAPSLSSINLSQCSFLTSAGISILAENLRPVLRELYIDDCQNVDVMSILPALKNLKHLEVLSVRGIQNVCDEFVCELIPVCGPNMKEIAFTNCGWVVWFYLTLLFNYWDFFDVFQIKIKEKHCFNLFFLSLVCILKDYPM